MKNNLTTIQEVQVFVKERIQKAGHHAKDVIQIVPVLLGHVLAYGEDITVKFEDSTPYGNLIWFNLNDTPYCLAYNHKTLKIDLRNRSQKGDSIKSFNNKTELDEISNLFSILSFELPTVNTLN